MTSLSSAIDKFGDLLGEPRAPRVQYIDNFARLPDMRAFTAEEREWIAQAERDEVKS